MTRPRLALFDCDGTLADSQYAIVDAMRAAFAANALPPPTPAAIRATIGLSIASALDHLLPDGDDALHAMVGDAYRQHYLAARTRVGSAPEPLFDGIAEVIDKLGADGWMLGVATGKSRRGLDRLLAAHSLSDRFATLQTADHHPSKPHPSMLFAALDATGVDAADCVMIGDTTHDIGMAVAAGVRSIGVTWGYHPAMMLREAGATLIVETPDALPGAITASLAQGA